MTRYLVIGSSGSGKSILARKVYNKCSIPYYDTDALYWGGDWKLRSDEQVIESLPWDSKSWIIDGNFVDYREQAWSKADEIIWLNMPALHVFWRVIRRNIRWTILEASPWTGRKMPLKIALGGIRHAISQFYRHKKSFPGFLKEFEGKKVYILKSQAECNNWIETIE